MNDLRTAAVVVLMFTSLAVYGGWSTYNGGYREGASAAATRVSGTVKLQSDAAYQQGYSNGSIDAVSKFIGGVDPGLAGDDRAVGPRCRVTSNVRPHPQDPTGQPAPVRECRLLQDGGLYVPNWRRPQ